MKLHGKAKDHTGLKVGALEVIRPTGRRLYKSLEWEALCRCGTLTTGKPADWLRQERNATNGVSPTCGCLRRARTTTHGLSKDPLYSVWASMISRCYNPAHWAYERYGGRGVTVCPEWLDTPEEFMRWATDKGWAEGLQLDKDILSIELGIYPPVYSPETCQFLTRKDNHPNSDLIKATKRGTFNE